MHENKMYKLWAHMGDRRDNAARPENVFMPALRTEKRQAKARTCFRAIGGMSWIAGLLVIAVTAAGIEQDRLSGWQLVVMAAVGLGLLGLTAAVSRMEERRLRNDKR